MAEKTLRLRGANMDVDLTTLADLISWVQGPCPWNLAEGTDAHRCAVKNVSICPHFGGIEPLDTVVCSYPGPDSPAELARNGYTISTDKARLDIAAIHAYLSERSYWATGRPLDVVQRAVENSLCFGVYAGDEQAGFARVVTDYATFGWVCDVFILEAHRGRGLGKWLVVAIVAHPDLAGLRTLLLATRDAHELYRRYGGFNPLPTPDSWLIRRRE
jgi:GNAT superfamily N-acetyltransferase